MNLNIRAPWNHLSYGIATRNIVKTLIGDGHIVVFFPIGGIQADLDEQEILRELIRNQRSFDKQAPSLTIFHQFSLAESVGYGRRCAMTFFELDRFTSQEKNHLDSQDLIIVPTRWAKKVVKNEVAGLDVAVVTLGVDTGTFKPFDAASQDSVTRFFNIGKWEIRKGHDILCEAFNAAFEPSDHVLLYMATHNPFLAEQEHKEWQSMYLNSPLGAKVRFIGPFKGAQDVAAAMNKMDCGVFPSRGESFHFGVLEMLACGKHVIVTDYSGHTEYCNEKNAMLIPITDLEEAYDGKFFLDDGVVNTGRWAKLAAQQFDCLVEHMRSVHRRKQNGDLGLNYEGLKTAELLTWNHTVDLLVGLLQS